MALFKLTTNFTFLITTGTISQILGFRWDIVSKPKVTDFIALEGNPFYFFCYKLSTHWMERLLSLSLVKAHSLFYTGQLEQLEYFDGALKRKCHLLKVLQQIVYYHYRLFVDDAHAIC